MQVESIVSSSLPPSSVSISGSRSTFTATSSEEKPAPDVKSAGDTTSFPTDKADNLEKVINSIQEAVKDSNITLKFSRDEDSGAIVIKLVDQASGEAIQQIPSKVMLHLAAVLGKLQGQIFNQKA